MVPDSPKPSPSSPSNKKDSTASVLPSSSASPFSFCMQGWHYRCLGLDPVMALHRKGIDKDEKQGKMNCGKKGEINRILITVTVIGSAGPIRFVVREEELVSSVMSTALKTYAREGRRPVLGSDLDCFVLYHAYDGSCALSPWEPIGSFGSRNFLLCKRQVKASDPERVIGKKGAGGWKAWFNKSLGLISSE